jgi:predicted DNA-binding protein with PD1-like motif
VAAAEPRAVGYSPEVTRTIVARLLPGQDLKRELLALAEREAVQAGWVLTCVGSLSQAVLRLAGGGEHITWREPLEIVSLVGTLSEGGGHLHLSVAGAEGRTFGGHLAEGCTVRTTAEVVVAADDRLRFDREHDPATGYDELVVRPGNSAHTGGAGSA